MNTFAHATGALAALALAGCASTSPYWDAHFGEATRSTTALQIINPHASENPDPVAGIDGKAAKAVMGEYSKSFSQPEAQPQFFTIGVGGGSGR